MTDPRIPRAIVPRRSLLAGMAAGMSAGVTLAAGGGALWADQGGEAGEGAAIAELPEAVQFLSLLGLFEAQHRIVAALHVAGDGAAAVEHLEGSHHAAYDDIAEGVAASGQPDFRPATEAFAALVTAGAAPDAVAAAAESVIAAIDAVRATTTAKDQMKAAEALLRVAASDMEAGVDDGQVTLAQEYRDSWGFALVALAWLEGLAADGNAEVATAATAALAGRDDVAAQYAGVDATQAPGDPAALLAAAARVELAAFRLK